MSRAADILVRLATKWRASFIPGITHQSQAGRAAWPDGKGTGTAAARSEPFLRTAWALFSTPHISESKWCTSQSHNDLFVLAKSVFYFTVKAAFSFEALATNRPQASTGVREGERGTGRQRMESSLSRFSMTITFTSGQILECKSKQNRRFSRASRLTKGTIYL